MLTASVVGAAVACGGESRSRAPDDGGSGGTTGGTGVGGTGALGGTGAFGGSGARGGTGALGGTGAFGGTGGSNAGRGGTGVAGRPNIAGTGGQPMGGASGFGNAAGTGNVAGSGGAPDPCATPSLNSCDGIPFFFHKAETGECLFAGWTVCATTPGFSSLAECLMACPGSKPAVDACDDTSQCTIVDPGCCGHCDPVKATDLVASNVQRVNDVRDCPGGVACGACPDVPELERTRQYFYTKCNIGRCELVDVRETAAVKCVADENCHLRAGSGCCESCQGLGLVSLSSTQYLQEMCQNVGCDACAPNIPVDYRAACDDQQRCVVTEASAGASNSAGGAPN